MVVVNLDYALLGSRSRLRLRFRFWFRLCFGFWSWFAWLFWLFLGGRLAFCNSNLGRSHASHAIFLSRYGIFLRVKSGLHVILIEWSKLVLFVGSTLASQYFFEIHYLSLKQVDPLVLYNFFLFWWLALIVNFMFLNRDITSNIFTMSLICFRRLISSI